jgi:cytochrome c oxidase cbb3-type subunit 3
MSKKEIDEVSGTETTGHEWDGIKELNTPLPRWWLWTFYATIVWAIGYMVLYPAIPLVTGATKGVLGYSSRADVAREIAEAKTGMAGLLDKVGSMSLEDIRKDPDLFQFAVAGGRSAFAVNCVQCHGSGASGGKGYPNLNDDEWLWGGSLDAIHTTLVHGVRFEGDDDTRVSDMPAFGRDGVLDTAQINDVAEHVLALSGREHDQAAAERGTAIFEENCAACHGAQGEGIADVGAPALNNAIWLYGGDKASLVETVTNARRGVMPAWGRRLDDATLKQLAVYVHSLGGGQ